MKLTLAMISVSRPEDYIHDTICSVLRDQALPLHLFIGKPDTDYVARYANGPLIFKHPCTAFEYDIVKLKSLRYRSVWNYWRALEMDYDSDYVLLMEDDVQYSQGWYKYVTEKILPFSGKSPVTLYTPDFNDTRTVPFDFVQKAVKSNQSTAKYPLPYFYGTQAVIYTKNTQKEMYDWFTENRIKDDPRPIDWLVRDFCISRNQDLLATAPGLVQHMGIQTTGLAGSSHQSNCYQPDVRHLHS